MGEEDALARSSLCHKWMDHVVQILCTLRLKGKKNKKNPSIDALHPRAVVGGEENNKPIFEERKAAQCE